MEKIDPKNLGFFEIYDKMTELCHNRNPNPFSAYNLFCWVIFIQVFHIVYVFTHFHIKFIVFPSFRWTLRFEIHRFDYNLAIDFVRKKLALKRFLFNVCFCVLVYFFVGFDLIICDLHFLTLLTKTGVMKNWLPNMKDGFSLALGSSFCFFQFLHTLLYNFLDF